MGLQAEGIALGLLGADVEKAHSGVLNTQNALGVEAAKIGELQQVLRGALGVGAAVAQNGPAAEHRDHRAHGGPAQAPDPLDHQSRAGKQRAGGAGGDESVALALLEKVQAHREGGILLHLEGGGGVVADLHHFAGVPDLHALGESGLSAGLHALEDVRGAAHQQNVHA